MGVITERWQFRTIPLDLLIVVVRYISRGVSYP